MYRCTEISITQPVVWTVEPLGYRLIKNPSEVRADLAFETAKKIDLETLENSFNRASLMKKNMYSRAQLDEFTLYLGGSVRKDKEEIINFIKNRIKEIFSSTSENVRK